MPPVDNEAIQHEGGQKVPSATLALHPREPRVTPFIDGNQPVESWLALPDSIIAELEWNGDLADKVAADLTEQGQGYFEFASHGIAQLIVGERDNTLPAQPGAIIAQFSAYPILLEDRVALRQHAIAEKLIKEFLPLSVKAVHSLVSLLGIETLDANFTKSINEMVTSLGLGGDREDSLWAVVKQMRELSSESTAIIAEQGSSVSSKKKREATDRLLGQLTKTRVFPPHLLIPHLSPNIVEDKQHTQIRVGGQELQLQLSANAIAKQKQLSSNLAQLTDYVTSLTLAVNVINMRWHKQDPELLGMLRSHILQAVKSISSSTDITTISNLDIIDSYFKYIAGLNQHVDKLLAIIFENV